MSTLSPRTKKKMAGLRTRRGLVAAVILLQAMVIGAGWYLTVHRGEKEVSSRVLDEVLEERRRSVERFATLLENEVGGPLTPGSAELTRAQSFVESYLLPQGATMMILDEHGRLLCHPSMDQSPAIFQANFGKAPVTIAETGVLTTLGDIRETRGTLADATSDEGNTAVAVVHSPKLGALVVARQPRTAMSAPAVRVMSGVTVMSGMAALAVLAISGLGSFMLVRRYDTMLERMNKELTQEVERQVGAAITIRNGIIMGLAKLADHRDNDTGRHLERISRYCGMLGRELDGTCGEIDDAWIERLTIASAMHDIGKVGVPDAILLKPGSLTQAERRVIERHPLIGADTLVEVRRHVGQDDLVEMSTDVALYHHEKWDGSGYPFGLSAHEIPLSARIVALADVYDALTSWRVYKSAMPHAEAVRIILGSRGTHFDPAVVTAFERVHERFDEIRRIMDDDGMGPLRLVPAEASAQAA